MVFSFLFLIGRKYSWEQDNISLGYGEVQGPLNYPLTGTGAIGGLFWRIPTNCYCPSGDQRIYYFKDYVTGNVSTLKIEEESGKLNYPLTPFTSTQVFGKQQFLCMLYENTPIAKC